jgi:hypothetical protein
LWRDVAFRADYNVTISEVVKNGDWYEATATVKANDYLRTIVFDIEGHGIYSDNYFDVEAGETKTITIRSQAKFNKEDITVSDFVNIIK